MNNSILKLRKLSCIPTAGSTYEVTCDTLELVDLVATAMRAELKVCICVLISTVEAAVTIMVN